MYLRHPRPWRALCLLIGLVVAITLAIQAQRPPRPLGLEAPPQAFSGLRAMKHLDWIAAEPHPVGAPAHDRVRDRLVAAFREAGLEVQTQRAQVLVNPRYRGESLAWVENILGRLKGAEGGGAVMIATHYDSAPGSFGAADAGIGIVTQLEILRALKAGPTLRHDVIFLVTDAEEVGLLGATAFVNTHPWMAEVKRVVNLEARGTGGPAWMHETSEGNADLLAALARATPRPAATSLAYDLSRLIPNGTDLMVLRPAGLRAMGFALVDRLWDYHFPTDHSSNLDPASLQQMGESALGLTRAFGSGDLGPGDGRDAIYFNILGFHLVRYPAAWVPWLSLLGLGLTTILLVRAFCRQGLTWTSLGLALGSLGLGLLVAATLAALLSTAVAWLHPVWGVREAWPMRAQGPFALRFNPWYLVVPLAAVGLTLSLMPRLVRREATRAALPTAILVFWGLLAPAVSWALPGGSYLFQWPWLLALAAALLAPTRLRAQIPAILAAVLLPVATVPLLGSVVGLSPVVGLALSVWLTLVVWLLWPAMESLREARLLLPASALMILVGFVGGGLWARATFKGRAFANVVYTANLDTGKAWWVAERWHEGPWTRRFMDQPRAGEPSWEGDGRLRPGNTATMIHQDAPLLEVPRPTLELRSDTTRDGLRTLRLTVMTAGAEEVRLEGSGERLVRANAEGHSLITRAMVRSGEMTRVVLADRKKDWRLVLLAPPADAPVEVELTFAGGDTPLRIGLQGRFGGLPAALGTKAEPLPGIRPIDWGNRTLVGRVLEVK